jgi:hypothetical protein
VEEFDRIMQSVAEGTYHPSHSAMETFPVRYTCTRNVCTVPYAYTKIHVYVYMHMYMYMYMHIYNVHVYMFAYVSNEVFMYSTLPKAYLLKPVVLSIC